MLFPFIALSILGLFLSLGVSYSLWKRRPGPAWGYAALTGLCVAVWCGGQTGWLLFGDGPAGEIIARIQHVGIALSPPLWLMTGLAYVGHREWLRPARIPNNNLDIAGNLDLGYISGCYLGEGDPQVTLASAKPITGAGAPATG